MKVCLRAVLFRGVTGSKLYSTYEYNISKCWHRLKIPLKSTESVNLKFSLSYKL